MLLQIHHNRAGIAIFSLFMATYLFYFYVRIRYTLHGGYFGYSLVVVVIELMSSTNMVRPPYLLALLANYCLSKESDTYLPQHRDLEVFLSKCVYTALDCLDR